MLPILIATLLALAPKAKAAEPKVLAFPFPIELHKLDNGLRVALIPYDSPGLVAYFTLMRVGSRNEVEKGRSGYAHFFEHMMFRGTKTHSAKDYNDTVTRLGLDSNASTDNDLTLYHLYGPAKALPTIIEYEADRFQHLEYDEAAFRTEAGAILGEYTKSASNPDQKLYEAMSETAYKIHPYAHTVIGYLQDVKNMPAGFDYSREFFRRYYTPDNATIIVIGDFDKADALSRIAKAYAGWSTKLDEARIPAEPKQTVSRRAQVTWDKPTLPRIWMAWHSPAASDLKAAAVQNLLNAYLFGPTSPLYQNLVLKKQVVEGMDATYGDHRDPGLFGVLVRVKNKKDLAAVEHSVLKEISALAGGRVDTARMAAVRSNLVYSNIMGLEKADALALVLAYNTMLTGDVQFLNKEFEAIEKVVPGDLSEFAKRNLLDINRTTVTLVSGGAQ
jgi:zinc protease